MTFRWDDDPPVDPAFEAYSDGFEHGAAAAFGLMGMAWEIHFEHSCPVCTFVTSSRTCEQCGYVELDRPSVLQGGEER